MNNHIGDANKMVGAAQGCDELRLRTDGERAAYLEGVEEGRRSTPAAPGIDLGQFRKAVMVYRNFSRFNESEANRLLALIDARPKGDAEKAIAAASAIQQYMRDDNHALPPEVFTTLPADAQTALVTLRGLADSPMRIHPRDAKEAVDYVVAHMVADSPKGGSDERTRFEAWATAYGFMPLGLLTEKPLQYSNTKTAFAWMAWQAALQATSAEVGA